MNRKIRRRMTQNAKRKILTVIIVLFVVSFICAAGYYLLEKKNALEGIYLSQIDELSDRITGSTRWVYKSTSDIKAGDEITMEKLETLEILSDDCSYISMSDIGSIALIDIPAGTIISNIYISEPLTDRNIREAEYDCIDITSNIDAGDYVDIRLRYPDGTDYILLSKKRIKRLNDTKLVFDILVQEEEILLLNSAIVDCSLYEGSSLYAVKYVQPALQEPSVVNYTPSPVISELICNNPNIVAVSSKYLSNELRKKHEVSLALFLSDEPKAKYDEAGSYIGTPTRAEEKAEELLNEGTMPGTQLPEALGTDLWDE